MRKSQVNLPPLVSPSSGVSPDNALEIDQSVGAQLQREMETRRLLDPYLFDQLSAILPKTAYAPFFLKPLPSFEEDPDFNPLPFLRTDELARHGSTYATARSMAELEALKKRQEELDRLSMYLANGPLHPVVAALLVGIVDPINLLPFGWVTTVARGASLGSKMAQGALIGASANLATEPFIRAADPFRDFVDTVEDVLIGGAFGAGIGALVSIPGAIRRARGPRSPEAQAEWDALRRRIDEEETARTGMTREDIARMRQGFRDAVDELNAVQAARVAKETGVEPTFRPGAGTVGAARSNQSEIIDDALREVAIELTGPRWLKGFLHKAFGTNQYTSFPGIELLTSPILASRLIIAKIADTGMITKAIAREMTDADLKEAYKRAVNKGLVGSEEDFLVEAQKRVETGIPMAPLAPLFSRTQYKERRLKKAYDDFMAAYKEAQELGFRGTEKDFDIVVNKYGRHKDDPKRYPDPVKDVPWREAVKRAFSEAWQKAISHPARQDILEIQPWENMVGKEHLREGYYAKMFDPEATREDISGFIKTWTIQLKRDFEAAKANVEAYDKVAEAYANRKKAAQELLAEVKKSATLRKDPKVKYLIERMLEEKRAAKEVDELEAKVRKEMKMSAWEFMKKMDDQGGPPRSPDENFKTVEEQFYDALKEAYKKRDEAGRRYEAARQQVGEYVASVTGKQAPPSLGARPEKPPRYEEDKKFIGPIEEGGVGSPGGIEKRAEEIVNEVLFGPELSRYADGGLRAFLKERTKDIDPVLFEPYLQKSFLRTIEQYHSLVSRDLEVMRTFKTLDVAEITKPIREEAARLQEEAKARGDLEGAKAIAAEAARNIETVQQLIQKARGTLDRPKNTREETTQAALRAGMSLAYMAKMGSAVFAQVGDPVKSISTYGSSRFFRALAQYFADAWAGTAKDMTKRAREEFGTALDMAMLNQQRLIHDVAPVGAPLGKVGRAIDRMTTIFSKLTLMPFFNDKLRITGTYLVDDLLMEGALAAKKGKPVPREAAELFSVSGLSREQVLALGEMYEKYGTMRGRLRDSNVEAWSAVDPALAEAYRLAAHIGAQRMLIVPSGADRPFWMQKTFGSTIMQLKGFIMASLPQLLVPFLQARAGKQVEIALAALALGSLSLVLRDLNTRGHIKERTPAGWVIDALDMSGLASFITDADATLGHISPYLSAKRLLTGEDLARYENRTRVGALLGPLAGMVGDLATALHGALDAAATDREIGIKEVRALRSVAPYQNWLGSRHFLDTLEAVMFEDAKARGLIAPYLYPDRPRP
jgi:hypothetical protein